MFLLESLSRTTQWEWFHSKLDTLRDDPEMQPTYEMAERQKALFSRSGGGEGGEQEMEEEVVSEPVGRARGGKGPGLGTCCCLEVRARRATPGNTCDFNPACGAGARSRRALNARLRGVDFLLRPLESQAEERWVSSAV